MKSADQTGARVVVVMTAFNRRESTVTCLARYEAAARRAGVEPVAVLMDDGSTDGTAPAVSERFPWVEVLVGRDLFWNRGMHAAQERAMGRMYDYLLWLNDDTLLREDALVRMIATERQVSARQGVRSIIVGSTADREHGNLTYGGHIVPKRWKPFSYRRVWSDNEPVQCHVMNGNVVLIPRVIAETVGNLDPVFEHAMGDTDYALRARKHGFCIFVAPGMQGWCSNNPPDGTYRDSKQPLKARWRQITSRKGLPPRSWRRFTQRHGGIAWPVYFVWPYVKVVISSLGSRVL